MISQRIHSASILHVCVSRACCWRDRGEARVTLTRPALTLTLTLTQGMGAHMEGRGPGSLVYAETQERVVSYLRDNFLRPLSFAVSGAGAGHEDRVEGLLEDCSERTLHRIVSVLDVNALEVSRADRADIVSISNRCDFCRIESTSARSTVFL